MACGRSVEGQYDLSALVADLSYMQVADLVADLCREAGEDPYGQEEGRG